VGVKQDLGRRAPAPVGASRPAGAERVALAEAAGASAKWNGSGC